jgi:hypothetical protein
MNHPNAWSWLSDLAAVEEPPGRLISQLEGQRDTPAVTASVQFGALQLNPNGPTRVPAHAGGKQYEAGLQARTNPGARPQDEPSLNPSQNAFRF